MEAKITKMNDESSVNVAKIMGKMLLQGYRMLADCCPECNNVIMQDKEGRHICVNCEQNFPGPTGDSQLHHKAASNNTERDSVDAGTGCTSDESKIRKIVANLLNEIHITSSELQNTFDYARKQERLDYALNCAKLVAELHKVFPPKFST